MAGDWTETRSGDKGKIVNAVRTRIARAASRGKPSGDTNADGQPRYGVYSDPEWASAAGTKAELFRFSTTKMGDAVVLAIEEIQERPSAF